jgi:outer membrane protein OmpA-like peptidoglycan-associated protein/tetratricopeptide (TPR) repeat protein
MIEMTSSKIISAFILPCFLFCTLGVLAQSKKEAKGDRLMERYAFQGATEVLLKALEEEKGENDAIKKKLAECYRMLNDPKNTALWYESIMDNNSIIEPIDKYYYAWSLNSLGDYTEAKEWFEIYAQEEPEDQRAEKYTAHLKNLEYLYKDSSRFQLDTVNFNSETADFSPAYYKDGLVFVSGRSKRKTKFKWNESAFLDIYRCVKDSTGNYTEPTAFNKKLNTRYHEGPISFYSNGEKLVLTRNNFEKGSLLKSADGVTKLKLYFASIDNEGKWSKSEPFQYNSDEYTVCHPTISEDGLTMYFISDMPGGYGGTDLYVTHFLDSAWSKPQNLGSKVNTEAKEMFPFLHNDNILYFASSGHGGLGGLDIIKYEFSSQEVTNVGYPLNSEKDDFGLIVTSAGNQGFIASNRNSENGTDNIYSFEFFPESTVPIKCIVVDALLNTPIADSRVVVKNKDDEIEDAIYRTNENGVVSVPMKLAQQYHIGASMPDYIDNSIDVLPNTEGEEIIIKLVKDCLPVKGLVQIPESQGQIDNIFVILTDKSTLQKDTIMVSENEYYEFCVKAKKEYNLSINKPKFFAQSFDFNTHENKPVEIKAVKLEEIILGKAIELENIYYDLAKWNIRDDAAVELDKLVKLLVDNATIEIELSSHTDSRGSDVYNLDLAQKRAKSAVEYIISQGIDSKRTTDKGYGETSLVNRCANGVKCSAEEHQANRRTEFKVLKY